MKNFRVLLLALFALSGSTAAAAASKAGTAVDLLIAGGLVVTMDGAQRVIEDGSIAVHNGEIIAVGNTAEMKAAYTATRTINAAGKLVMPGLINTHTHAAMTMFRGMADDLPLATWLEQHIWPAEAEFISARSVRTGANLALAEMIRSGTTTFNDMYFFADEVALAAKKAGVRALLGEPVIDFPTPSSATPADALAKTEELARTWKNDPLINISVTPHSPYLCAPGVLKAARNLADKLALPLHIHVSETRKEVDDIRSKYGVTPFEHLDKVGFFGGTVIAAHAVYPTAREIGLMAARKVGVAHNPVSNMKLASGVAPLPEMRKAGVMVGLGTDGAASNNNLNMFKEMHAAALLQKVSRLEPTDMSALETVEAATIGGARVLGMDAQIGSLEAGKRADLIMINLDRPHLVPVYNVYSHIVYAMQASDIDTVLIDGKTVMQDKKLLTLNEAQIMREAKELGMLIAESLKKSAGM